MEAGTTSGKRNNSQDAIAAVVVQDHRRSDGPEVVGDGALAVNEGDREPAGCEVARRLAARAEVDYEVEVSVARRNDGGK